jgi:cysteinyl-tRNA synthetase
MRVVLVIVALLLGAGLVACKRTQPAAPDDAQDTTHAPGSAAQPGQSQSPPAQPQPSRTPPGAQNITSWVYQLQNYDHDRLDAVAKAPAQLAVIDLARDAKSDWFRPDELAALHRSGKRVLAYFEIGSIENFRPEHKSLPRDLILNVWPDWPDEQFVRYWDSRWWDLVVRPRIDQAIKAGFDGVYLDTPLAYEELDLSLVRGENRDHLAGLMSDLIVRISRYAKQKHPGFWIFPQNSPELRAQPGYVEAIDGIGMEELFYEATDQPCNEDYCTENLDNTRALRDAGKLVLAVDYATDPGNIRKACDRYRNERFAGYVTVRDLDRITSPCP